MTKVQLLKWLDGKQRSAVAEVDEQYRAAKERLLAMKIEKSGYLELAESVLPLLQEVYDKLEAIHKDHEDLIGPNYFSYGELPYALRRIFFSNTQPVDCLMAQVIRGTQMDKNLKNQYETLERKVKKTYETVAGERPRHGEREAGGRVSERARLRSAPVGNRCASAHNGAHGSGRPQLSAAGGQA